MQRCSASLDTWIVRACWAFLIVWIALTFDQHGISNDEYVQHTYGQLLLDWYRTGFKDDDAFHYRNLYLYGGLFDLVAAWLQPHTLLWVWDLRHLLSALFGLLGFYGVVQYAKLLGGSRLAWLTMLGLFLTSAWSGAMFTHTKDVPFATCMLWALYATAWVIRDMEQVRAKYIVLLGLAVGGALGLRVGGAFAVIYLFVLVVWRILSDYQQYQTPILMRCWRMLLVLLPAGVMAFIFMAICWPWSVIEADNLLEAAQSFSHFDFSMQTIANGVVYNISDVPRSYLFQYLAVKLPEVVLLGLLGLPLLGLLNARVKHNSAPTQRVALITLCVGIFFPLLFVIEDRPALYNGVRHFTFLLPLIVLLGSWSLLTIWQRLSLVVGQWRRWVAPLWLGLALGLATVNLVDIVQLYPYDYVRINRVAGSPQQAQYQWEGDYWSSALRDVSTQLMDYPLPRREAPYLVGACVDTPQIEPYLDSRFRITRKWEEADFYIATTHMHCHQVMKGRIIGQVSRQGMLLAVLRDRRQLSGAERFGTPAKN